MTDRHAGYVIALEKDMREDDAQSTIEAIKHIRGVLSVTPVLGEYGIQIAKEQARWELRAKLWKALEE